MYILLRFQLGEGQNNPIIILQYIMVILHIIYIFFTKQQKNNNNNIDYYYYVQNTRSGIVEQVKVVDSWKLPMFIAIYSKNIAIRFRQNDSCLCGIHVQF
eukprot:TRINITY_DN46841_c0_g1_i1.p8 TRINITY_DN46841_c0_g1~~TRINITY_DN46841_c0_g1_i1.p8  ORF type:complete len:100 (+),score=0.30 TRINITY_DN46841_c0_g1_i1:1196-1495(+)